MSMSDPISDTLTRIRNASNAKLPKASMPSSKMKASLAETLKDAGYIDDYSVEDIGNNRKELTIVLKYKGKMKSPA
ncbi:MAG: 30S ribosomal protein S8, partial [Victivallales bacterium]|nr:30S ribosomal protein S8 [Victivallales bacterium]